MFAKLTSYQFLIVAVIAVLWVLGLFWIWIRKQKPDIEGRFSKFMAWRIYQDRPHGTVHEWLSASVEQQGTSGPMSRLELALTWTVMAGVVVAWLFFEWTKVV